MMQKAINVKVKMDLRSSIVVRDFNIHYPKSYYFFNFASIALKVLIQEIIVKKFYLKKFKSKKIKLANINTIILSWTNMIESLKQNKKNKKDKK